MHIGEILDKIDAFAWGPIMLILIGFTGLYLTLGLRFFTVRSIPRSIAFFFKDFFAREDENPTEKSEGIKPSKALLTALSATVGVGNIAGVATAIYMGGPGALFYMWILAFVGLATKYAEAFLAVEFRSKNSQGQNIGGPMYYIRDGIGARFPRVGKTLAMLFAIFLAIACFGTGNLVQSNTVANAIATFHVPHWITGAILVVTVGLTLVGGIKSISKVAALLVPFMIIIYLFSTIVVLVLNYHSIPAGFALIFRSAFHPAAAVGGFAGASVIAAMRFGVARGVFSNEAGLGTAPIAHAASETKDPIRQGLIGMLGTFTDTIIICTLTGLTIIVSGAWSSGTTGAELTINAFSTHMNMGPVVIFSLALFAFTTMLGWSYYGETAFRYIFGERSVCIYRILWVIAIPFGVFFDLHFVWTISDIFNAFMAFPNLIALLFLSPLVFKRTFGSRTLKPKVKGNGTQ